jgi:hypothetical protein
MDNGVFGTYGNAMAAQTAKSGGIGTSFLLKKVSKG